MGLYDFTFYDLIRCHALSFGERPAWLEIEDGRTLTFSQFKQQTDRLATGLQQYGIKKGERIGILAKNSPEYFLLFGAAAAIGAIVLPINWRLSEDEVCYNFGDCEPRAIFAGSEYQALVNNIKEKLPSVESYFSLGQGGKDFLDYRKLLDNQGNFEPAEVSMDDGFVIIHTAAVAGRPRGALLSHGNVLYADMHFAYLMKITQEDVHLNFLPLFHVGGLFMATTCFHAGALNLNVTRFDAAQAAELVEEKKVSFMMVFSPMLSSILEENKKKGVDLGSLRAVTGIDSPETIEKYEEISGGTFYTMYGQTETSCLASFGPYNDRPGAAGRMLPLAEVRLVDDHDQPVPIGKVGEITMKGPMVFKGYWSLPDDTSYTFREGWHHTGDLAHFDEQGFLWYAGRKAEKELIKPGGENVYPAEVEKVILQHHAVEEVVVFGVPDPKWKEGIKAVCKLKKGERPDAQSLIDFVGERIARYKKPQYVDFVTELPLQEDGSIDREKVKELYGGKK